MSRARGGAPGIRIGSGTLRGRRLEAGPETRPTGGRVREALIDRWRPRLSGATLLDLFAGTGAVGLHAVSCGARRLVSVERSRATADALRRTVTAWHLEDSVRVVSSDALSYLGSSDRSFDLIFADPPYDFDAYDALVTAALARLEPGGELVIEHRAGETIEIPADGGWDREERRYGESALLAVRAGEAP